MVDTIFKILFFVCLEKGEWRLYSLLKKLYSIRDLYWPQKAPLQNKGERAIRVLIYLFMHLLIFELVYLCIY